ncbi:MAG: universal stress protein, partial [Desulfobacterales bacterium]|nr:universal stress protein [Desulfobacterales bacterium]
RRAVLYVAQLLEGAEDFRVTILHVINEPEEDYFPTTDEKEKWLSQYKKKVDKMLEDYRQILIHKGFDRSAVSVRSTLRYCPSMAQCILEERDETEYSTVVVGRQGLSRSEEFLFGSVSSKIVNYARNCTVWVVE